MGPAGQGPVEKPSPSRRAYFDRLVAEYRTLPGEPINPHAAAVASDILQSFEKNPTGLTAAAANTFETAVMRLQPDENLPRVVRSLRTQYREILGERAFLAYEAANPLRMDGSEPARLRAEIDFLVGEIQRLSSLIPIRERLRNTFTLWVGSITLVAFVLTIAFVLWKMPDYFPGSGPAPASPGRPPVDPLLTLILAAAAGGIGGFISMLRRLHDLPIEHATFLQLRYGWFSVALSPIYGMIFATVLYLIFMSGLVKGALFPEFHTFTVYAGPAAADQNPSTPAAGSAGAGRVGGGTAGGGTTGGGAPVGNAAGTGGSVSTGSAGQTAAPGTGGTTTNARGGTPAAGDPRRGEATTDAPYSVPSLRVTEPATVAAFGLLLVWCFIAGFMEQFVPDTLNAIVARSRKPEDVTPLLPGGGATDGAPSAGDGAGRGGEGARRGDGSPGSSIAPTLADVTLNPDHVRGQGSVQGAVRLSTAAPERLSVSLKSSAPAAASVPSQVAIEAGKREGTFPVTVPAAQAAAQVTVEASLSGKTVSGVIGLEPS